MKKTMRINITTALYIILNYFYLKITCDKFSFLDFIKFSFSDLSYCESIGLTKWNIFRLSSMIVLLVWWLVELLKDISETSKYTSMLIHRYHNLLDYYTYIVKTYSKAIFELLGYYVIYAFILYILLGIGFQTKLIFLHLDIVFFHFIKLFFIYLFFICIINLFDLINKGQIAYITISILLILYVMSEISGLHSGILFFTNRLVLNLFYIFISILFMSILFIGYKFCVERRDIL